MKKLSLLLALAALLVFGVAGNIAYKPDEIKTITWSFDLWQYFPDNGDCWDDGSNNWEPCAALGDVDTGWARMVPSKGNSIRLIEMRCRAGDIATFATAAHTIAVGVRHWTSGSPTLKLAEDAWASDTDAPADGELFTSRFSGAGSTIAADSLVGFQFLGSNSDVTELTGSCTLYWSK